MINLGLAFRAGVLALLLGAVGAAYAAPHAGDIQPHGRDGAIGLNDSLFVGDFSDLLGGPFRTNDPGFDVDLDLGPLGAGNLLRYEALGALRFWNGTVWGAPVGSESFRIDDVFGSTANPGDDTIIDADGVVARAVGVVGEIRADGGLHKHLTFGLRQAGGSLGGTTGAYLVTLRLLETPANQDTALRYSAPFTLVMNRGLTTGDFDLAVAAVPLPASLPLALGAVVALAAARRRIASTAPRSNTSEGASA